MKRTFSAKDVERWLTADAEDIPFEYERIAAGNIESGHRISRFARIHEGAGLTQIALLDYAKALGHFAAASSAWAYLLERHTAGDEIDQDLLDAAPAGLILAVTSGAEDACSRMVAAYEGAFPADRKSRNGDHRIGMSLSALCQRNVELARKRLSSKLRNSHRPETVELVESIIDHDELRLANLAARLTEEWKQRIRHERLGRFPHAVCDHYQIGWLQLARRVWGFRPNMDLAAAHIPPEIFDATAVLVDGKI